MGSEEEPTPSYLLEDLADPASHELREKESEMPSLPTYEEGGDRPYFHRLLNHAVLTLDEERTLFREIARAQKGWREYAMRVGLAALRVAQAGFEGAHSQNPQIMLRRSFNTDPELMISSVSEVVPPVYELVHANRALLTSTPNYDMSLMKRIQKNSAEHSQILLLWEANAQTLEARLNGEEHYPGLLTYASKIEGWKRLHTAGKIAHAEYTQIYRAVAAELGLIPEEFLEVLKDILHQREIYYQKVEQAVMGNQRLVYSMAKKRKDSLEETYLAIDDLISLGNEGLRKGIERFNVERGYKFSTYGCWWIKQAIRREIDNSRSAVRIPLHIKERIVQVKRAIRQLYKEHENAEGRYIPTMEDIASITGLEERQIQGALDAGKERLYLDEEHSRGGKAAYSGSNSEGDYHESIVDESQVAPYETTHNAFVHKNLRTALLTLSERERSVLSLRYGLDGDRPLTLEEVGYKYGITRERSRQIEAKALRKLRHPHRRKILEVCAEDLKA